jgi:hypothetical protein
MIDIVKGFNTQFLYLHGDPLLPIYIISQIFVGLVDTGSNLSVMHSNVFLQNIFKMLFSIKNDYGKISFSG